MFLLQFRLSLIQYARKMTDRYDESSSESIQSFKANLVWKKNSDKISIFPKAKFPLALLCQLFRLKPTCYPFVTWKCVEQWGKLMWTNDILICYSFRPCWFRMHRLHSSVSYVHINEVEQTHNIPPHIEMFSIILCGKRTSHKPTIRCTIEELKINSFFL